MALDPRWRAVGISLALSTLGIIAAGTILHAQNPSPVALDVAIRPSAYERDTVIDTVAWKDSYVDVNTSLTNLGEPDLLNIDFTVSSDLFLAWCVERTHLGAQILTKPLVETVVTLPGRIPLDRYTHMNYDSYHVSCPRLPSHQSLSFLVVPVGGEYEFAPRKNPKFLELSGTYRIEGSQATFSFHLRHDF